jgi:Icc protein
MNLSFAQITDHHLGESEADLFHGYNPAYAFRTVLSHIAQNETFQPDFIVSTGDLVENPTELAYASLKKMLNLGSAPSEAPGPFQISIEGLQDMPMFALPGNHDDRDNFFRSLFEKSPPMSLMNVAFIHKNIQFICLDWGPDAKGVAHPETMSYLDNALAIDLPSIILMHHHLVELGSRWMDAFLADDISSFEKIIAGRNILGIFCGHAHMTYESAIANIPIFGLRSTSYSFVLQDEPLACLLPPHYRAITVEDGVLSTEIFEVAL